MRRAGRASYQRIPSAAAGRDDILVNNAATVEPPGPAIGIQAGDLRLAYEVTVIAPAALTAAVLPGMLDAGWGRVVNVSSGIVASPAGMVRGNAYAATKAVLEAHTVNLAAELADTGVTVNAYRPGGVDTAMHAWIRRQDPERIGGLHEWFNKNYAEGTLITPNTQPRRSRPPGRRRHRRDLGRQHRLRWRLTQLATAPSSARRSDAAARPQLCPG